MCARNVLMTSTAGRAEILASMGRRGAAICEQMHLLPQLSAPALLDISQGGDGRENHLMLHTEHLLSRSLRNENFDNKDSSCDRGKTDREEAGPISISLTLTMRHIESAILCSPSNKPLLAPPTATCRSDTILATAFSSVLLNTATSFALWRASLVVLCLTSTTGAVCNSKTLCWILRQASPSA